MATFIPVASAQTLDLIITGVFDGPLSGGTPKGVELYVVNNISDLSIYGLGSANNGGGSDGEEFTGFSGTATAGDFIYVATESTQFTNFFGFAPDYTTGAMAINGDDAIELFTNGSVSDTFGDINASGSGQAWDYLDGWAYRVDGTGPDGTTFNVSNWNFSGTNVFDSCSTTNAACGTPFPIGSFSTIGGGGSSVTAPYTQDFEGGFPDDFTVVSVDADTANTWTTGSSINGTSAQGNGFGDSASANDWLISPEIDFSGLTDPVLSFDTWTRFSDSGTTDPEVSVFWSSDYAGSGDPTLATWNALTYTFPAENSQTITSSGEIDLSVIGVTQAYFAWNYVSSGTGAGTSAWWEVDNIVIDEPASGGTVLSLLISEIQGNSTTQVAGGHHDDLSPFDGQSVEIQGIVIGDFQASDQLDGFFVQEEDADSDLDDTTSEGIFVYCDETCENVAVGDLVTVTGAVDDYFGMTQIDNDNGDRSVVINSSGNALPTAGSISLPVVGDIDDFYEQYEGMLVNFADTLTVSEYFQIARFGEVVLYQGGRPFQYTHNDNTPTVGEFATFQDNLERRVVVLDDDNNIQNSPLPNGVIFHPQTGGFGVGTQGVNFFRGGDTVTALTGIIHRSWGGFSGTDAWRVRPVESQPAIFNAVNTRPAITQPGGNVTVASFNVLNYFTTLDAGSNTSGPSGLDPRGASSTDELTRQTDKLVQALNNIDADVFGLMEIENTSDSTAVNAVVTALNAVSSDTYDFINPNPSGSPNPTASTSPNGFVGTDAITVAIIYKSSVVTPVGNTVIVDENAFIDPNGSGTGRNRPALVQSFEVTDASNPDFGSVFTVVINHFKSKGDSGLDSDNDGVCDNPSNVDCDQGDGQGYWNNTRTAASNYLVNTVLTDPNPTGVVDTDYLIIGDLNAYKGESPITTAIGSGYTDLIESFNGSTAYGYVFDGQLGYLDHALSNPSMTTQVVNVVEAHINADEVNIFDYNNTVQDGNEASFEAKPTGNSLYEVNMFRTSDHDPVLIGLDLTPLIIAEELQEDDGTTIAGTLEDDNVLYIQVEFSGDVATDAEAITTPDDSVTNTDNYVLIYDNGDGTIDSTIDVDFCNSGTIDVNDAQVGIASVSYDDNANAGPYVATLSFTTALDEGNYVLVVCASTSIVDAVSGATAINGGEDGQFPFEIVFPAGGSGDSDDNSSSSDGVATTNNNTTTTLDNASFVDGGLDINGDGIADVTSLPQTGEAPWWSKVIKWLIVLLGGMGILGSTGVLYSRRR